MSLLPRATSPLEARASGRTSVSAAMTAVRCSWQASCSERPSADEIARWASSVRSETFPSGPRGLATVSVRPERDAIADGGVDVSPEEVYPNSDAIDLEGCELLPRVSSSLLLPVEQLSASAVNQQGAAKRTRTDWDRFVGPWSMPAPGSVVRGMRGLTMEGRATFSNAVCSSSSVVPQQVRVPSLKKKMSACE